MSKQTADNFIRAFDALVEESPSDALAVITGAFVSLTLAVMKSHGYAPEGEIKIDGGEQRDITIHAAKQKGGTQ